LAQSYVTWIDYIAGAAIYGLSAVFVVTLATQRAAQAAFGKGLIAWLQAVFAVLGVAAVLMFQWALVEHWPAWMFWPYPCLTLGLTVLNVIAGLRFRSRPGRKPVPAAGSVEPA